MIQSTAIREWFLNNENFENREIERILDVDYAHLKLDSGDDLYVTEFGIPHIDILLPENYYYDKIWFMNNSSELAGTSCVYKVKTKTVNSYHKDLVFKWNRMGQDVPGAIESERLHSAEFNSPFEEFSLVKDLMISMNKTHGNVFIHRPLAIFVPPDKDELWRTGRKDYKMSSILKSHDEEVLLDIKRSYAVIYEWIDGIDASFACEEGLIDEDLLKKLTLDADEKMEENGYMVRDRKPNHIILNTETVQKKITSLDEISDYALIDFELLEMTQKKKDGVCEEKRHDYHVRQKDRFKTKTIPLDPNVKESNVFNVDYICGNVESTRGRLWVVGKDPLLFDYFLPERWETTPKTKISLTNNVFYTLSKDKINLVWKVSRVGFRPDADPFRKEEKRILEQGHNSPFEEFSIALHLINNGIRTIYPRAIYMTSRNDQVSPHLIDESRYESHKGISCFDGKDILQRDKQYVTIWGYWNGPDEKLAELDDNYDIAINALNAYREKMISEKEYITLMNEVRRKLLKAGIEDLNLRGKHILLSLDDNNEIICNESHEAEWRICNFEMLKIKKHFWQV